MPAKPRILFLEEHPGAMLQLQKEFGSLKHQWDLDFIDNAADAIAKIKAGPAYEVVVVDIALKTDDPVNVFTVLSATRPNTIRFALTDRADDQRIQRTTPLAHQFVYSPCDSHILRIQVTRALTLREKLRACPLRHKLHSQNALPPLPRFYQEVMREIHSDDPSVARIAAIISKDVAMSAKLLQVVNSAGVGLRNEVTNVTQAASLLGMHRISSMVLVAEVFGLIGGKRMPKGFSPDSLWAHSLRVGEFAKRITQAQTSDTRSAEAAFTSGLLHDVGLILVAIHMPDQLTDALNLARAENKCLLEAELETLGATHAEVGGYLLELWGLPDAIVEAIAYHDFPSHLPQQDYTANTAMLEFPPLTSVHIGNYFCEESQRGQYGCAEAVFDRDYLEKAGLLDRLEEWWKLCTEDQTFSKR